MGRKDLAMALNPLSEIGSGLGWNVAVVVEYREAGQVPPGDNNLIVYVLLVSHIQRVCGYSIKFNRGVSDRLQHLCHACHVAFGR